MFQVEVYLESKVYICGYSPAIGTFRPVSLTDISNSHR
jgi:hypothetical protein